MPAAALRACGVDAAAERTVRAILDSYDRSNALNLVTLSALLARLRKEAAPAARTPAPAQTPEPAIDAALPPLLALAEMPAETAALVRAVNRLGTRGRTISWSACRASSPIGRASWRSTGRCWRRWMRTAGCTPASTPSAPTRAPRAPGSRRISASLPCRQPDALAAVETSLDDFCQNAISRMIPVVSLLQTAMPRDG